MFYLKDFKRQITLRESFELDLTDASNNFSVLGPDTFNSPRWFRGMTLLSIRWVKEVRPGTWSFARQLTNLVLWNNTFTALGSSTANFTVL